MSATTSTYFPLATEDPYTGSDGASASTGVDNEGGASGPSSGNSGISHGALIAIIIIVVVVAVGGILFYLAKKREWKVRETIRRSARKVVTALTPRRSEFPRSARDGPASRSRRHARLDDVPPTPRLPQDLEKGLGRPSEKKTRKIRPIFPNVRA